MLWVRIPLWPICAHGRVAQRQRRSIQARVVEGSNPSPASLRTNSAQVVRRFGGGSPIGRRHEDEVLGSVGSNPTRRILHVDTGPHSAWELFLTADCKSVV